MTWNADFAIVYAYGLTLFAALLMWAVPSVLSALGQSLQAWAYKRGWSRRAEAKSAAPAPSRNQARSGRYPQPVR